VWGTSQRDVRVRPCFRGWVVCPRADIGIGKVLITVISWSGSPAWRDAARNSPSGERKHKPDKLCQAESRRMQT